MGLLLCWVPYAAPGILGAHCGHCSEKLLVIKGEGYLTAAQNQDHAQYTFQPVNKYKKTKCSCSVPSPVLQGCPSLALQELLIRSTQFGLTSNAMKNSLSTALSLRLILVCSALWPGLARDDAVIQALPAAVPTPLLSLSSEGESKCSMLG